MAKLQYNKREFRTQDSGLNHGYFNPTLTMYLRVFLKTREGELQGGLSPSPCDLLIISSDCFETWHIDSAIF